MQKSIKQKHSPKVKKPKIPTMPYSRMTPALWRTSAEHVKWLSDNLNGNTIFRDLLAMLTNVRVVQGNSAEFELGRIQGHREFVDVIVQCAEPMPMEQAEIKAEYAEEDPEITEIES